MATKTEQVQSQKIKLTNKQNKAFSLFISKTKKDILSAPSSPAVLLHINTRTITIHYQWQWAVGASSEGKAVFKKTQYGNKRNGMKNNDESICALWTNDC